MKPDPLYIVQIVPYYPPHLGGVEQRVKRLSDQLAERGRTVHVVTSDSSGQKEETENPKVHYLPGKEVANSPILWKLPFTLWRMPKNSVFHIHIAQAFLPEVATLVAKLRGIPYVVHYRMDVEATSKAGALLPLYKKLVLGPVMRGARKVIVLTPDYAALAHKKFGVQRKRLVVIPNATDFSVSRHAKGRARAPLRLLFVGRLAIQKDPLLFVKLTEYYKRKYGDVQAIMVGEGPMRPEIEAYINQKGLHDIIRLVGQKNGRQLEDYYARSDIFVLTSHGESFGTVLIEAMAKGLPIVSTRIPAVRNIVKQGINGLLASATPQALAKACRILVKDHEQYKAMSKANLAETKKYNWPAIIDQTEEVYRSL